MSGTELRERRRIDNAGFFGRGRPGSRVRLVQENRGQTPVNKSRQPSPDAPVPAFLQRGFTYLGVLLIIAVMGAGLAAFGELYSHAAQREKERELLFIGNQFREAVGSYYNKSPGAKVYPKKLEDLLEDKRFPMPQRHLRRVYMDPMTGGTEWGLVEAPGGGFMGVHSLSEETPVKSGNFSAKDEAFDGAEHYTKWMFTYSPGGLGSKVAAGDRR
ncbi:MAG TPA: type II secretion system protein [Burkholderiales bacterium]|nr:type II secretion system protein [Burkholderiales bacterium]